MLYAISPVLLAKIGFLLARRRWPNLDCPKIFAEKDRRAALKVVYAVALFVAAAIPWLLYAGVGRQSGSVGYDPLLKRRRIT